MENSQKVVLPKQHGVWAMLIIPFVLSAIISGFTWIHIPFFVAWVLLYRAMNPLLMAFKFPKNKQAYLKLFYPNFVVAMLLLLVVLFFQWKLVFFGLAMAPFFFINIYFAKQRNERAFFNDLIGILLFCLGGMGSYYVGRGSLEEAYVLNGMCFLFFVGSIFFVKTMIREKKNIYFKWYSWMYHLFLIVGLIFSGNWLFSIPFYVSFIRAFVLYGKDVSVMKVGMTEIFNSIYFAIVMLWIFL